MHFHFVDVNHAFHSLVKGIKNQTIPTEKNDTRNGPVLRVVEPVTVTYQNPIHRVLLNMARDCNPFFHMFESLWMLAGRNDVAPLEKYNSNIKNYSDDGNIFHGAYGHRWRKWFGYDQLTAIIDELATNPESRRCVLGLWDPSRDLWMAFTGGKDVPCNTNIYFDIDKTIKSINMQSTSKGLEEEIEYVSRLNMTVCNRSNDLIWGMLGANVVHMSMLQEYMALCLGIEVGNYNQFTNNLHVYTGTNSGWKPDKWLAEYNRTMYSPPILSYDKFQNLVPLVSNKEIFDKEVAAFVANTDWTKNWKEPFLQDVASTMCWAFELHKRREYTSALNAMQTVKADDWRTMGTLWIEDRKARWEKKNENVRN